MRTVKEIMKILPYSCKENDSLEFIASYMSISATKFLPVIDENQKILGTITFDTLCDAIKKNNLSEHTLTAAEVMNPRPVFIHSHDDEASALKKMRIHHLGQLPVVDDENHLRGIVSFITIARRLIKLKNSIQLSNHNPAKINRLKLSFN